jgi:hypothetical protein
MPCSPEKRELIKLFPLLAKPMEEFFRAAILLSSVALAKEEVALVVPLHSKPANLPGDSANTSPMIWEVMIF